MIAKLSKAERYLGTHGPSKVSYLRLQAMEIHTYIDSNNAGINDSLRWKWCEQAVEAVTYVHENNAINSDLRPEIYYSRRR